jgi:hypothetical protein
MENRGWMEDGRRTYKKCFPPFARGGRGGSGQAVQADSSPISHCLSPFFNTLRGRTSPDTVETTHS